MQPVSRRLLLTAGIAMALTQGRQPYAAGKLRVVATFTVLADMVGAVGGERVELTTLVGPDGDAHVYEPTPADARALARADLVVTNGHGFEGWIDRLVKASGYKGPRVVASDGVTPLAAEEERAPGTQGAAVQAHAHGHNGDEHDPHAWQDLANGRVYVANIARALVGADAANAGEYRSRAKAYDRELAALDRDIRRLLAAAPVDRRKVITSHDAFRYFGRAYGVAFHAPVGLSTESEPSAGELAALVRQMKQEGIRALFMENISNPKLIEQLAREAGAVVGGTLYSDSLSGPDGPAATYLDMFRHNVGEIAKAVIG